MKIPPGYTEQDVLAAITKATNILAPNFVFGHYDVEDLKQQGFLIALKVLEKGNYDPARPLANWLYTSIKNGYINLRRDECRRNDPPCKPCHGGSPCGLAADGSHCPNYAKWLARNQTKANIANPLRIDAVSDDGDCRARPSSAAEEQVEIDELLQRIDEELPVELRATYLQMRSGVSVPKTARLKVEAAVKEILSGVIEECPSETD